MNHEKESVEKTLDSIQIMAEGIIAAVMKTRVEMRTNPRPPCEECIYQAQAAQEHDAAIRKYAITSDEVSDIVDQAVDVARAQERERVLEEFERAFRESAIESRVFKIIESLRKGAP